MNLWKIVSPQIFSYILVCCLDEKVLEPASVLKTENPKTSIIHPTPTVRSPNIRSLVGYSNLPFSVRRLLARRLLLLLQRGFGKQQHADSGKETANRNSRPMADLHQQQPTSCEPDYLQTGHDSVTAPPLLLWWARPGRRHVWTMTAKFAKLFINPGLAGFPFGFELWLWIYFTVNAGSSLCFNLFFF